MTVLTFEATFEDVFDGVGAAGLRRGPAAFFAGTFFVGTFFVALRGVAALGPEAFAAAVMSPE